jgi:hypothetical protein
MNTQEQKEKIIARFSRISRTSYWTGRVEVRDGRNFVVLYLIEESSPYGQMFTESLLNCRGRGN